MRALHLLFPLTVAVATSTTTTTETLHSTSASSVRSHHPYWPGNGRPLFGPKLSSWLSQQWQDKHTTSTASGGPSQEQERTTIYTVPTTSTTTLERTTTVKPVHKSNLSAICAQPKPTLKEQAPASENNNPSETDATVVVMRTVIVSPLPTMNRIYELATIPTPSSRTSPPTLTLESSSETRKRSWTAPTAGRGITNSGQGFVGNVIPKHPGEAAIGLSGKDRVPNSQYTSDVVYTTTFSSQCDTLGCHQTVTQILTTPVVVVVTTNSTVTVCPPDATDCTTVWQTSSRPVTLPASQSDAALTTMTMEVLTTMQMFTYTGSTSASRPKPVPQTTTSQASGKPLGSSPTPATIDPATDRPLPSAGTQLNGTAIDRCFDIAGGVSTDGTTTGCGSLFEHVMVCYDAIGPWNDPYNAVQNKAFQSCFCDTTATRPFSPQGPLWQNFTGCSHCLLTFGSGLDIGLLVSEGERIESFCSSQNPNTYLALSGFEQWLGKLLAYAQVTDLPLTGAIAQVNTLAQKFTTVPPLANLAYGNSAPFDGSLKGVTPEMTTFTTTSIVGGPYGTWKDTQVVTQLISWVPTAAAGNSGTFEAALASASANQAAVSALSSALVSLQAQGGPTQRCIGPCPTSSADRNGLVMVKAGLVVVLAFVAIVAVL